jgi:hypothetical protein
MFRRELIAILKARPISLHGLALLLDEAPRDLEDNLQHLFRSLRVSHYRVYLVKPGAYGSTSHAQLPARSLECWRSTLARRPGSSAPTSSIPRCASAERAIKARTSARDPPTESGKLSAELVLGVTAAGLLQRFESDDDPSLVTLDPAVAAEYGAA